MSGYIKGNVRPHLAISRVLNSDTLDHRFHIGSYEAGMNHAVLDAHSQRHPVLGGEREGPLQQQHQGGGEQQSGVDGNQRDDENAGEGDEHVGQEDQDHDGQGNNHAAGNNINGIQPLPPPRSASPYVRGRGHDPDGHFAAAAESRRRRAAKRARVLARREVGRLRRWEEWREGVWEPLVPPA
ncbi:hypothetical protein KC340_g17432 [Hortaea werneckii]|nr:hypothetical protein KC342_g18416 [Hortaea werneckii]KAI7063154.1 hypothetical protein KC339_g16355 [Hortaea werneckii]KAI7208402.1 hypothetical protein KC365_g16098 [Hortaea werneckii]KAI7290342.1 hypothetical protein KC340_g17432 [Hortaea werneckii]KAI7372374.1 hypothetical protein KC328_g17297 [Hortaea werneckii]